VLVGLRCTFLLLLLNLVCIWMYHVKLFYVTVYFVRILCIMCCHLGVIKNNNDDDNNNNGCEKSWRVQLVNAERAF